MTQALEVELNSEEKKELSCQFLGEWCGISRLLLLNYGFKSVRKYTLLNKSKIENKSNNY